MDYSGISDYAVQKKLLSFVESDPTVGSAQIQNAIWTDIMANNVVGSTSNRTLLISPFQPTLEYDFRFAIRILPPYDMGPYIPSVFVPACDPNGQIQVYEASS
ncbi:hypothetical protein D9756_006368 [Leucocoprinus leucothites]|uniref:Uncharacterized protein n=1 Tax=Leucocoprinus leucothites TaxID=201217 RepID=A0A8H5G2M4_9AGAR|nr:hypothetical protein D9756_006368 [Leucoagaricus leucothites]